MKGHEKTEIDMNRQEERIEKLKDMRKHEKT